MAFTMGLKIQLAHGRCGKQSSKSFKTRVAKTCHCNTNNITELFWLNQSSPKVEVIDLTLDSKFWKVSEEGIVLQPLLQSTSYKWWLIKVIIWTNTRENPLSLLLWGLEHMHYFLGVREAEMKLSKSPSAASQSYIKIK